MEGGGLVKIGAHPGTGIIHFHTPILLLLLFIFWQNLIQEQKKLESTTKLDTSVTCRESHWERVETDRSTRGEMSVSSVQSII